MIDQELTTTVPVAGDKGYTSKTLAEAPARTKPASIKLGQRMKSEPLLLPGYCTHRLGVYHG